MFDRSSQVYWDAHLGDDFEAFSTIDGHVGAFPPNPSFGELNHTKREAWSIPWMEVNTPANPHVASSPMNFVEIFEFSFEFAHFFRTIRA